MTLNAYLEQPDAPSMTALSAKLGISKGRLSQLRNAAEWPADLAMRLEEATDGAVNAAALSEIVARARGLAA